MRDIPSQHSFSASALPIKHQCWQIRNAHFIQFFRCSINSNDILRYTFSSFLRRNLASGNSSVSSAIKRCCKLYGNSINFLLLSNLRNIFSLNCSSFLDDYRIQNDFNGFLRVSHIAIANKSNKTSFTIIHLRNPPTQSSPLLLQPPKHTRTVQSSFRVALLHG